MELKWLEDFLCLAKTHSFSKASAERNVTQSAFSRRIQGLEQWLGVVLIDRSTYPTALTEDGLQFLETAEETLRMLHGSRYHFQAKSRPNMQMVSIAALHTLSLVFFPAWFRQIETEVGPVDSRLLPDDYHNCLQALVEGGYDFLLTYHHPSVPVPLDSDQYPYIVVGRDDFTAVYSPALERGGDAGAFPLLGYAANSFLGRVATFAHAQGGIPAIRVAHTNENSMADALKRMAIEGHGLAWLPRSLVQQELADSTLLSLSADIPLEIRLYRNARRTRPVVEKVWRAAQSASSR
ncbi:LysR substrate-binding domain-containing protein (plasmid) [Agrobacterium vitis]|uniref:LysR substrate-binding domain-containing protein n=1 Tax=Rhizobium/Agrobacterium group TaxID=227290 RepID=UPI00203492F0|nr:LysR family transcriptional regulator [Rhizobium sp. CG5]MCM2476128.1 LysR family transcriptional regulator [Rhizobium sp. CG5]